MSEFSLKAGKGPFESLQRQACERLDGRQQIRMGLIGLIKHSARTDPVLAAIAIAPNVNLKHKL